MSSAPEPFEVRVEPAIVDDLRERLRRARWERPAEAGWEYGADLGYVRELCGHWSERYDPGHLEERLNRFANHLADGVHFIRAGGGGGLPVLLVHGWPSGPILYDALIGPLVAAGHEVVVPSLPGFAWSEQPARPLNAAGMAARLHRLMAATLGHERYAVHGEDWGAMIAARMAFDEPGAVAALHISTPSLLPRPADLADPPPSEAERRFVETGLRWQRREGFHLFVQGSAPDALAAGLADSPAGLAAWLVEKYRRWSDCDGDVERRFSRDDLCDFLTMYWATGTIGSSMRLYAAEARDRWRLASGERITVPAGVADFPAEIVRAPRDWAERALADLRRFTEMPRGGHFGAFEEPDLLADDVLAFLADL